MKIGICGSVNKAEIAKKMGFDYIEENLAKIAEISDTEFSETVNFYERLDMPVYSFNCYLPSEISVYGEGAFEEIKKYSEKAIERAYALGGSICVFGSGGQRKIPDGMDRKIAEKKFLSIVTACAEIADKKGINLVVEPLSRSDTNLINTVEEGAEFARATGLSNVGALVDFYHFFKNGDTEESLKSAKDILIHTHIARPNPDRMMPTEEDIPTLKHWADMLKEINYSGAISLEAKYGDSFEDMITERTKYLQVVREV